MLDDLPVHHPNNPMMPGAVRIGAAGEQLYSNLYGKEMEMMRKMMNLDEPTGGADMGGHHPMMKYGQPTMAARNFGPNIPHGMLTEVEMKHLTAMSGGGYPGAGPAARFPYPNQMGGGGYGNKFDGLLRPCYNNTNTPVGGLIGNGGRFPFNPSPVPTFGTPATQIPNNNFICDPPHFNNGGGGGGNKTPNCGVVIKQENNNLNCGGNMANNLISSDFHNNSTLPITGNNNDLISTGGVNTKCSDDPFGKSNTTGSTNLLISNNNANNNSHSINTNTNLSNSSSNNSKNEPNTFSNLTRNVIDKASNKSRQVHPHRGKCMGDDDDDVHSMDGGPGMGGEEERKSASNNMLDHDSNDEYTDL